MNWSGEKRSTALVAWSTLIIASVAIAVGLISPASATGATIEVTTAADSEAFDGLCSLREAVFTADQDTRISDRDGECIAGNGADTIVLTVPGPYVLAVDPANSLWIIGSDITILGNGHTIDADGTGRIFQVGTGGSFTLENVVLTGANTDFGGAVNNFGSLTVRDSTIVGNHASRRGGGIHSRGSITIVDSIVQQNTSSEDGAGIYSAIFDDENAVVVETSTIASNTADRDGGGIFVGRGPVAIIDSTIRDNLADSDGAGAYVDQGLLTTTNSTFDSNFAGAQGGGIAIATGTLTSVNSTISRNRAAHGGGIRNNLGQIDLRFVSIARNTATTLHGGLSSHFFAAVDGTAPALVSASLIVGNSSPDTASRDVGDGAIASGGHNVIGLTPLTTFTASGDVTGDVGAGVEFSPADNGGPTRTIAITADSSAFNRVSGGHPDVTTDQRGQARPPGFADAGAFELDSPCVTASFDVTTAEEIETAIECHNRTPRGIFVIDVRNDITLDRLLPEIDRPDSVLLSLAIRAGGRTIDASGFGRGLAIASSEVDIAQLRITNVDGSAITNGGTLLLTDVELTANGTTAFDTRGGGVHNWGDLTVERSLIEGNTADRGGGIYNTGTLSLVNSTVSGNVSATSGSGIDNTLGGDAELLFATVTNNDSGAGGAALSSSSSATTTVGASIIAGNVSDDVVVISSLESLGHNVVGTGDTTPFDQPGDVTGVVDAGLSPLADNGGATATHALLPSSPAINRAAGSLPEVDVDQRAVVRPAESKDAGAFEAAQSRTTVLGSPCLLYDSVSAEGALAGPLDGGETRTVVVAGGCIPAEATSVTVSITAVSPLAPGNLRLGPAGVPTNGGVVNYTTNGLDNTNTVTIPLGPNGDLDVTANGGPFGQGLPSTDVRLVARSYESPTGSLEFHPITPCAVADSRSTQGAGAGFTGPFGSTSYLVDVVGTFPENQGGGNTDCGVPATATAVLVNVVATNGSGGTGSVSIGSTGPSDEPVVNYADLGMNNAATATIGLNGEIIVISTDGLPGASTNVRVVALGYYENGPGDVFTPVTACAAFDTRASQNATGAFLGPRLGGQTTTYQVTGTIPSGQGGNGGDCNVPSGASSVLVNLVALNPVAEGNLQAAAAGTTPTGGVLNYASLTPAMTNANAVVVPLDANGQIDVTVNGGPFGVGLASTDVRGVVLGYFG